MRYSVASFSNAGPRPENEDAIGVWPTKDGLAVAVADGLGGMGGGKRASGIAISCFERFLHAPHVNPLELREVAQNIHTEILTAQKTSLEFSTMATTFTAGMFVNDQLYLVHSGDSRIAVARHKGIIRLTVDHSEAHRLFTSGKLNKDELRNYPRKNILESALGVNGAIEIYDGKFEVEAGDKFFFSTDGTHNKVLLRELHQFAGESTDPFVLVSRVESTIRNRGADDNYSLIVVYADI